MNERAAGVLLDGRATGQHPEAGTEPTHRSQVTVGSLFSGVGGFDLGLERAGMRVLWQVEFDKQCQSVLRHRFPETEIYGDVREVGGTNPIGQDGAVQQSRPGNGQRNADSDVREVGGVGHTEPSHRRGRVSHAAGGDRQRATKHATPPASPNGATAGDRAAATLPVCDLICGGFPCQDLSVAGQRRGLVDGDRSSLWFEFHRIIAEITPRWVLIENVPGLLSSNDGRDMGVVVRGLEELGYGWAYRVLDSQYFGVAQRRRRVFIVGHLGTPEPAIRALFPVGTGLPGDTAPSREARERPATSPADIPATCGTLSDGAHMGGGLNGQDAYTGRIIPVQSAPRRLTPRECERLQGFPDDWTLVDHKGKPMSDGPRYRMMGNAVTVNVAEWIGHRIMEVGM